MKEIGTCSLCGAIIYDDDNGAIEIERGLFCTISCAEEATRHKVLTGKLLVVSTCENGDKEYNYICPHCHKNNGQDEGSSVSMENGRCVTTCVYCGKESICKEDS